MVRTHARVVASVVLAAFAIGCAGEVTSVMRSEEPMFVLVLDPDTVRARSDSILGRRPDLRALLATSGTPLAVEFRSAERFDMRRDADGALFDWREDPQPDGLFLPIVGNYVLAESASAQGLGRRDLRAGESYTLEILTGGRTIVGRTTIPAHPSARLVERGDGSRVVEWSRDATVGGYLVHAETDKEPEHLTTDTFYVLREDLPAALLPATPRFRVTAVDSNWYRFLMDSSSHAAGIDGARGVFGARSGTEAEISPRP